METNNTKIQCAVFDLDGTLLNTLKTINYYLNFALQKNSLGTICEDDCRAFVGDGAVKLIMRALNRLGADESRFDSVFTDYNKAYNADPYYLTEPYHGITDMLNELKAEGITLAVLSNKPDFATKAAIDHFFPGTFDLAFGAREGVSLKPDPASLLSMLDEIKIDKKQTAYIGDSEPDVFTAKNADVSMSISVLWGFRSEDQLRDVGANLFAREPSDVVKYIIK